MLKKETLELKQKIRDHIKAMRFNWEEEPRNDDDVEAVYRLMWDICDKCWMQVDFDFVDWWDCYVYATVYVPDMIWENLSYNVIVDIDVKTYGYEDEEDFIDTMIGYEVHAQKILDHFKK